MNEGKEDRVSVACTDGGEMFTQAEWSRIMEGFEKPGPGAQTGCWRLKSYYMFVDSFVRQVFMKHSGF